MSRQTRCRCLYREGLPPEFREHPLEEGVRLRQLVADEAGKSPNRFRVMSLREDLHCKRRDLLTAKETSGEECFGDVEGEM